MRATNARSQTWLTRLALIGLASLALLTPSCAWDGHMDLLGYSTKPNYDLRYQTVSVPIFKNKTYMTVTPSPGMEMDLTRAVIREIQMKTPYKVVQHDADTELVGTIVMFQKNLINYTSFNTVREAETIMTVEFVWRDRRTGEVLTKTARRLGDPGPPEPRESLLGINSSLLPPGSKPPVAPGLPSTPSSGIVRQGEEEMVDPVTKKKIIPVVVRSRANFRPELGESITTAIQKNIDRMAVQIVSAMENGW